MKSLPLPNKPYPDWSRFIAALWDHGRKQTVMNKAIINSHTYRAQSAICGSMTPREDEGTFVRPSGGLQCARYMHYIVRGETPDPMPEQIGMTFAVGHLLHEISYAAVRSGLPPCFSCEFEKPVDLPDWWPEHEKFKQAGTVDLVISVCDELGAAEYIAQPAPAKMLVDFKTMGGYSHREHKKKMFGLEPDAFGYLAQLAVYADSLGVIDDGAILAGINRDLLMQPLAPRLVTAEVLKAELVRVKAAILSALAGEDPGPAFHMIWGPRADFYCGRAGKKGYCNFKRLCAEEPFGV